MRNLPSLTEFKGNDFNFVAIGSVILENIPQLSSNGIQFGEHECFRYTYSLQSSNAAALSVYIKNRNPYIPFEMSKLTNSSNTVIIPNWYFNGNSVKTFNISNNGDLKQIVIGENCFGKVRVFELDRLSELENVVIGKESFRISNSERSDGSYR
ncbi:hypothetical protein WA588_005731, partial [Blastocystis sp. NMH]